MFSPETKSKSDIGYNGFPVLLSYFTALPDPNVISSPHVTVIFKSLMKRDSTTKEKSLNELQAIFNQQSKQELRDEGIIQCWIQIFAKLAFDNSRNVRLSALKVQASYLQLMGGKAFSKYLKSSLPIWLSLEYDADKQISTVAYSSLVDSFGDKERVDSKIWEIFHSEILHFIEASLFYETKKTLSDERNTTDDDSVAKHERIINGSLNLLNKLVVLVNQGMSIDYSFDDLLDNESLWEPMTQCFASKTFNASMANTYLVLMKSMFQEDQVEKGTQNKFCKQLSSARSIYKHVLKRFIKQIKLKASNNSQTIVFGMMILQFWGTLINLTKFSSLEGKKKPKENFWDISSSGQTRLIDYIQLGACNSDPIYYILLKNCLLLILQHSNLEFKESKLAQSIVSTIVSDMNKVRIGYKETALECLIGFTRAIDENLLKEALPSLVEISNNIKGPKGKFLDLLADALGEDSDSALETQQKDILQYISSGKNPVEINAFVELVNKVSFDVSGLVSEILTLIEDDGCAKRGFEVLTKLVKKVKLNEKVSEELEEFNSSVAMYMEKDTDYVIDYLFTIWANKEADVEVVDDLIVKFQMLELDTSILINKLLNKFSWTYEELPEELKGYIDSLVPKKKTAEEWTLIMKFVDSLFDEILDNNDETEVVRNFTSTKKIVSQSPKLDGFLSKCWSLNPKIIDLIDPELVRGSMWTYLETEDVNWDLLAGELPYLYSQLDLRLTNLPNINKDMLAVSNSIGQNIHLIEAKDGKPLSLKVIENFFKVQDLDTFHGLILGQYVEDYVFLTGQDVTFEYKKPLVQYEFGTVMDSLLSTTSDKLLGQLVNGLDAKGAIQSYSARILKDILENASENIMSTALDQYDFNPLLRSPVKLAITLSALTNHVTHTKFDRVRNYVVSEILGVKNPIDGLKWVVLTVNFLVDGFIIPPHRLNMIVKQFEKWLDSEYAYEPEFIPIRSQITKILKFFDSDNDLCERLISDNLDLIKISPQDTYELRYATLKFGISKNELSDLLFDETVIDADNKVNNHVVIMCLELLKRALGSTSIDGDINKFMELCLNTKFQPIKQICIDQLIIKINKAQQDLVIDYQLNKDEEMVVKLPEILINHVKLFHYQEDTGIHGNINYYVVWYLLLIHFKDITYSIRNQYLSQIKGDNLLDKFLEVVFEIEQIDYKKGEFDDEIDIESETFIIQLYYLSCKYVGSEVQQWFNGLRNVQMKQHIETFTKAHCSSKLIDLMLTGVEDSKNKLTDDVMTLRVNRVINEVRSIFEIDDQTMEMVIKIPSNFPLESVVVEGPKKVGLKENEWKAWLLSSQRVISLTNGSVLEAIELFKKNVNLHFSGFEDCAICYSILHQDHSLPSKSCPTCSNKFHAACLYKWFKSSGSSTCPLCRSTFNFRKT